MTGSHLHTEPREDRRNRTIRFIPASTRGRESIPPVDHEPRLDRLSNSKLGHVIADAALAGYEEEDAAHTARVEGFVHAVQVLTGMFPQNAHQNPLLYPAIAEAQARIVEIAEGKIHG